MTDRLVKASCFLVVVAVIMLPGCSPEELHRLLLVSFDGFRWDYLKRVPTPNFNALMEEGVRVQQVENTYITKTFPNHYTMVTGLHAESHGIVANEMFDPDLNLTFSMDRMDTYDPRWWDEGVPLWVTNQRAGHRSGAAMWPGSDVEIHQMYPTHYLPYNASMSFQDRVQKLIDWFTQEQPISLGVLYWEEPDKSGHRLGPDSPLMNEVIADIDGKLGSLLGQLKKAGIYDEVNLVVTSDHGMAQLSTDRIIELDDYVSSDLYTWIDKSPVVAVLPKEGKYDEVYNALANANPNMTVYKKEDIPDHYHYKRNDRIMPIIIEAKEGWTIMQNKNGTFMLGNHGYDNTLPSMHPVFVARGPAFRRGYSMASMRSVDLYPLMCHILAVPPAPNNGTLGSVRDLLKESAPPTATPPTPASGESTYAPVLGSLLGAALVVGFLFVFVKQVTRKQLPSLPIGNLEIAQPLLQEELQI